MPAITDQPPDEINTELEGLRAALDQQIPRKVLDYNLLVATWNIRSFGNLTEKWAGGSGDRPKRDPHALLCNVEIISRHACPEPLFHRETRQSQTFRIGS